MTGQAESVRQVRRANSGRGTRFPSRDGIRGIRSLALIARSWPGARTVQLEIGVLGKLMVTFGLIFIVLLGGILVDRLYARFKRGGPFRDKEKCG